MEAIVFVIVFIAMLCIFFAPTVIAFNRKHPNKWPICILNVFSFFTMGILWIVALMWVLWSLPTAKKD
jgi:uncharacterized BrkB/YihY/UPF0761 family membrane protein